MEKEEGYAGHAMVLTCGAKYGTAPRRRVKYVSLAGSSDAGGDPTNQETETKSSKLSSCIRLSLRDANRGLLVSRRKYLLTKWTYGEIASNKVVARRKVMEINLLECSRIIFVKLCTYINYIRMCVRA